MSRIVFEIGACSTTVLHTFSWAKQMHNRHDTTVKMCALLVSFRDHFGGAAHTFLDPACGGS